MSIHEKMAAEFPKRTTVKCEKCGDLREVTSEQVASYFAKGWPECCGYTMTWNAKPKESPRAR